MLKSLVEADNWVALYALPHLPFINVIPLVKWGLLLQDKEQKLIGYVTGSEARCVTADTPRGDGSIFCGYYRPTGISDYDAGVFRQLWNEVIAVGQALAEARDTEVTDG